MLSHLSLRSVVSSFIHASSFNHSFGLLSRWIVYAQVILFGVYGLVYLVAAWDFVTPVAEQLLYTYGDATTKLSHSAFILAVHRTLRLKAVSDARMKADVTAKDLAQLVDTANAPIVSVDLEGSIVIWNKKLAHLTGLRLEAAKGLQLLDMVSSECKPQVKEAISACAAGKEAVPQFTMDLEISDELLEEADYVDSWDNNDGAKSGIGGRASTGRGSFSSDGSYGKSNAGKRGKVKRVPMTMNATAFHGAESGSVEGVVGVGQDLTEVTRYVLR
jgi:PAS domain-containing protein